MKHFSLNINGAQIYVEQCGSGEPLLMVPGVGAGSWLWNSMAPDLSKNYELIMPHLRGSGRSEKPDHSYSVPQMAEDMTAIVDQMGYEKFHILGVSLGGYIAQQFAIRWPKKVASLALIATSSGGSDSIGPDGNTLSQSIRLRGKTRKERLEEIYQLNFTEDFIQNNGEELDKITNWRIQYPQPEFAYYRQILAGYGYIQNGTLDAVSVPTFIAGGKDDKMIPLDDVKMLHQKINQSILKIYEGKHLFFFEDREQFNQDVISFIQSHPIEGGK
ncbi:MAG: alpha/beta hydrolase [Candidatus Marinimicrobia bacterium]|nr:alpha/beta hydrolase [Candidatus Neomarinimicrobiota bacterium]